MSSSDNILEVENLKMYFPVSVGNAKAVVKAVDDVSFCIERGKTYGLVGESGCGKTTTGKCILRVFKPTDGVVRYEGNDIAQSTSKQLAPIRRDIQLIFQDPYGSLDPRQSIASILGEAITADHKKHDRGEVKKRIVELLELVELSSEMMERYPHELSGGQRQRLGIARALACNPKLIVCDEPVSALDVSIQAQIVNLFKRLQKQLSLTYLFIAHDLAVVKHIADSIGVMYLGNLVETMDAEEFHRSPMHPYTQALLSAVPITDYDVEKTRERIVLQGEVPSPINAPSGCPFHPRCIFATDKCKQCKPRLETVAKNHQVACFHVQESQGIVKSGE